MKWADCYRLLESEGVLDRFSLPSDGLAGFNCEPGVSISDLTGAIGWAITTPGDTLLREPKIAAFFEIDGLATGHTASYFFGWVAVTLIIMGLLEWMGR